MMQRRSFFGVVVGGFLARWLPLPKQIRFRGATIPVQQYQPGQFGFGFSGFKPTEIERWAAQRQIESEIEREIVQDAVRTIAPGQRLLQQWRVPGR